ncbi:MAG: DUF72 domain-containing protein [Acidobacteriota bacterium]|nr:DUF72 domain-containing protein [Acidobacteriota bacterium]
MKSTVRLGTSGFGVSRDKYVNLFSCVEVQHTFYQPPRISTLERWRQETPPDFEFVLKAWQLITHESKSPTYRRLKRKLTETEKQDAGYFKPTPIVKEAWELTLACAGALHAKTILFQCPVSFKQTKEHISNLERFFSGINRENLEFCWEPRGAWNSEVISSICKAHKLRHVVDSFTAKTVTPKHCYFRLHGKTGWRYKYDDAELEELASLLPEAPSTRTHPYVFFNNIRMTEDAVRFQEIIESSKL